MVLLATTEVGTPSSTTRISRQVVTAQTGVVQATTSGSGNISAGTDVTVNFNTSGTLARVYVKVGQHVHKGQLLATLDRAAARLTLKQDRKTLTAAKDQLSSDESKYAIIVQRQPGHDRLGQHPVRQRNDPARQHAYLDDQRRGNDRCYELVLNDDYVAHHDDVAHHDNLAQDDNFADHDNLAGSHHDGADRYQPGHDPRDLGQQLGLDLG